MARRRRRRREEPPPLAFYIGLLGGLIGVMRTMPQFAGITGPVQSSLQVLEEASLLAVFVGTISFALRLLSYAERGDIYHAMTYTTQYIVEYALESIVDGIASALGYTLGVVIGAKIAEALAAFPT